MNRIETNSTKIPTILLGDGTTGLLPTVLSGGNLGEDTASLGMYFNQGGGYTPGRYSFIKENQQPDFAISFTNINSISAMIKQLRKTKRLFRRVEVKRNQMEASNE